MSRVEPEHIGSSTSKLSRGAGLRAGDAHRQRITRQRISLREAAGKGPANGLSRIGGSGVPSSQHMDNLDSKLLLHAGKPSARNVGAEVGSASNMEELSKLHLKEDRMQQLSTERHRR